jgi:RsbT co-antagonist protein rsbRD N-terminal domain
LSRVWPKDGRERERKVEAFAREHGWRLRHYRDGFVAIFDEERPQPTPTEESIGAQLAIFLSERREQILSDCIAAVERDEKVSTSDTLNPTQLRDDLPEMLDNLAMVLNDAFSQDLKQEAAWTAAAHADLRWKEHYDISELLREFAHLRSILIRHLVEFQGLNQATGASWLFAETVVHRYLDDAIQSSVEQYLAISERSRGK